MYSTIPDRIFHVAFFYYSSACNWNKSLKYFRVMFQVTSFNLICETAFFVLINNSINDAFRLIGNWYRQCIK